MKLTLIVAGLFFGLIAALSLARKRISKWEAALSGMLATIALIFMTATPMPNGKAFRIENGRPIPID